MSLKCPNCDHPLKLKLPQPGQYRSKCKQCGGGFRLVVSTDEAVAPAIRKLKPKNEPSRSTTNPKTAQAKKTPKAAPPDVDTRPEFQETIVPATTPDPSAVGEASSGREATSTRVAESKPSLPPKRKPSTTVATNDPPELLSGYRILDELGHGAMGAVYRAHQISLDREVALKTILPKYAKQPRMIARFTREAYAAAQISHHNVVHIHDLGCDHGTYFFAMEFVDGKPLSDVLEEHGKLDATMAVSYTLQAARGLQAAHCHGLVHRDVKPANLLISDDGIVKVADLGLVKVLNADDIGIDDITDVGSLAAAKADITLANVAMGTAAFMAPEQADNATAVDHRADIYSLGCTLYVLLTGTTPFQGTTALEVISKHKTEPVIRPDMVVNRIPKELSEIVMRMVTKRPIDRPDNMGQVIDDLETFLGVSSTGSFSPTEEHADTLERCVNEFNQAPGTRRRSLLGIGFPLGCLVVGLLSFFFSPWLGTALIGCGVMTVVSYFVIGGVKDKTDLFGRVRELLALSSWTDRLTWFGGLVLLLAIAWVANMLFVGIALLVVSIGLALAYYTVCDRGVAKERAESIKTVEEMLRGMRLRGLEESDLRGFVARYSGNDWEEFYESLFGYRAKLEARLDIERGGVGKGRRRFRRWRDSIHELVGSRIKAHHERLDQQHLQKVEQDDLKAQGVADADAVEQAKQIAATMVQEAVDSKSVEKELPVAAIDPAIAAEEKRQRIKKMLAEARSSKPQKRGVVGLLSALISPWFGSRMRFIVGCALVTGCLLWVRQNGFVSSDDIKAVTDQALAGDVSQIGDSIQIDSDAPTTPLRIPIVGVFFDSFLPGIAGLLLLCSAFVSGGRMSLFAIPAAVVVLFGPSFGIPGIAAIGGAATTSVVLGLGLIVVGFVFARLY